MIGDVADAVAIKIVPFVFVPVIPAEIVLYGIPVGGDIESICHEIVPAERIFDTACHQAQGPAVLAENIFLQCERQAAFHEDTHRISGKFVAGNSTMGNVLEQKSVRSSPRVVSERIVLHIDVVGKHDGDARSVFVEYVMEVIVIVGEHKVQAVPQTSRDIIIPDDGIGNEFEIDAVPVPADMISFDGKVPAFPAMDGISDERVFRNGRTYPIILQPATLRLLNEYSDGIIGKLIAFDRHSGDTPVYF